MQSHKTRSMQLYTLSPIGLTTLRQKQNYQTLEKFIEDLCSKLFILLLFVR